MAVRDFRRPDGTMNGRGELVAAARVNMADPNQFLKLQAVQVASKVRTPRAWDWYDSIGEVHFALNNQARTIGHAELLPFRREGLQQHHEASRCC